MKKKLTALAISVAIGLTGAFALATPAHAAKNATCNFAPNGDVGRGSTGAFVREVQCLLNRAVSPLTYGNLEVDGDFGPRTEGKTRLFQRCANTRGANLAVDGRVGPKTWSYLYYWAWNSRYVC